MRVVLLSQLVILIIILFLAGLASSLDIRTVEFFFIQESLRVKFFIGPIIDQCVFSSLIDYWVCCF